jgi:predicted transcriptional regulator
MSSFFIRGFRTPGEAASSALGTLERQVMDLLWERAGEASVREVHDAFQGSHAYTTLMTTLDRLYKKGLLVRRKERRSLFSTLVEAVGERDRKLLLELERLVAEKRRQLREDRE